MATAWIFIDEQGDAKFGSMNSTYFGLAAVTTIDPVGVCRGVDELRHALWLDGTLRRSSFHAQEDTWPTRRRMLQLLPSLPIVRTDVVALTKARLDSHLRAPEIMYRFALSTLLRHAIAPQARGIVLVMAAWPSVPDLLVHADAVVRQVGLSGARLVQVPAQAHLALQVADYVAWASHRARTRGEAWVSYTRATREGWSDRVIV